MTASKAIKVLDMFLYKQCDLARTEFDYDQNTVWTAVRMARDVLENKRPSSEEEKENIIEALQGVIDLVERTGWRTDNPPDEHKEYLVQYESGGMGVCRWTNVNHFWTDLTTDWHWHIMDVPQFEKVKAWTLLPEPYVEGRED